MRVIRRRYVIGLCVLLLHGFLPSLAAAPRVLQTLEHTPLAHGDILLELGFDGTVPAPEVFTTHDPARIVVDFANTRSQLPQRQWKIDHAALSRITVTSNHARTRMVLSVSTPGDYRSDIVGDTLRFTLMGALSEPPHEPAAADSGKHARVAASSMLEKINFRRRADGVGRVVIDYTGQALQAQIHQEPGTVRIGFENADIHPRVERHLDVRDFATAVSAIDISHNEHRRITLDVAVDNAVHVTTKTHAQQFIINVNPATAPQKDAFVPGEAVQDHAAKRISFNFQDIPVRAALQLIAEESGLDLVAADSVAGSITLKLDQVPWDQALDIILRAKGLDRRQHGKVIWIAPQSELVAYEQNRMETRIKREHAGILETVYIPISYGSAKDIAHLLTADARSGRKNDEEGMVRTGNFLSSRGSVSFDERTNTLLIHDVAEKIRSIRQLVTVLDKPVKQVLIEARIVAATDTFARELGARWGMQVHRQRGGHSSYGLGASTHSALDAANQTLTLGDMSQRGYNVNLPIANPAGSMALAVLGRHFLIDLELQAAQTEGRTEIISSPRVITANQQQANIRQGQEIGYVTFDGNDDGRSRPDVRFKDAVLALDVTPTITADGRVYLRINVDQDTLDRFIDSPGGGQVPLLNTRSINTSVLVNDEQTVVLGGIYEVYKSNSTSKVPGLGDIPILGALFRRTEKSEEKAELLIFVTPRILATPDSDD